MKGNEMRVLHVSEAFGGGIQSYFDGLFKELNGRRGIEFSLAYSVRSETDVERLETIPDFVRKIELPTIYNERTFLGLLRWYVEVGRVVKGGGYDVVHFHSSFAGVLGRLVMLGRKEKVYYTPHGYSFLRKDVSIAHRRLFGFVEFLCNKLIKSTVVACSRTEGEAARKCGASKVEVINNAIDVPELDAVPASKLMIERKEVVAGIVGRITEARNPEFFLSLSEDLGRLGLDVALLWIGDGDSVFREKLEQSGVVVTGWVRRRDALAMMKGLDVYIQPSLWEGMPYSVIEAQCAGIPVVASNIVGNKDVVLHEQTGYLANNYDEFLKYIVDLMDEGRRREFSKKARVHGRNQFSVSQQLSSLLNLYNQGRAL